MSLRKIAQISRDVELISLAFLLFPSRYQLLNFVAVVERGSISATNRGDKMKILLPLSLSLSLARAPVRALKVGS